MKQAVHSTFDPLPPPVRLLVPVSVRAGVTALPRPAGTRVAAGDRLADSAHQLDHWPLAPVAGRIVGSADAMLTSGVRTGVIALELEQTPDLAGLAGTQSTTPPVDPPPRETDRGAWLDRLRSFGLHADRRTCPDLIAQFHESFRRPIDTVVCSILDGDPNLPIGAALSSRETENLIAGIRAAGRIVAAGRCLAVLQTRLLPSVVSALRQTRDIKAVEIVNDYPQADPTILLASLLKRRLRPFHLPTEQGVLLLDAVAAVTIGRIVLQNRPMLAVPIAVFDHARNATHLQLLPIGTPLNHLLTQRSMADTGYHYRAGDVLRDQRVFRETILAGGENILHVSPGDTPINPDPCIRCGWCVESCPSKIHPAGLLDAAQRRDRAQADYYGLHACVECGQCDYVCPSRLPILAGIRALRRS